MPAEKVERSPLKLHVDRLFKEDGYTSAELLLPLLTQQVGMPELIDFTLEDLEAYLQKQIESVTGDSILDLGYKAAREIIERYVAGDEHLRAAISPDKFIQIVIKVQEAFGNKGEKRPVFRWSCFGCPLDLSKPTLGDLVLFLRRAGGDEAKKPLERSKHTGQFWDLADELDGCLARCR